MSNIVKKSLSVILILTMLFSVFVINSSAANVEEENTIMPRWSVISGVGTSFIISGINSTSTVSLTAKYSTSLYIKIEFQKEESTGYKTLETWEKSGTGTMIALEKTRLINIFADYRIKVTCTAGGETFTTFDYP
jgi:hypothetical protein